MDKMDRTMPLFNGKTTIFPAKIYLLKVNNKIE